MGILIGIAIIFILMFALGVPNEVIVFVALAILLLFSTFCTIFFIVSLINLLRCKRSEGRFVRLIYSDDNAPDKPSNANVELNATERYAAEHYKIAVNKDNDDKEVKIDNKRNKMAFAGYAVNIENKSVILRNIFPTDDFMVGMYKKDVTVNLGIINIRRNTYVVDSITKVIILIGLPVFAIISAILVPLIMQYMYIFN